MGVVTRPALGRVTKVLERLVAAVGETTGPSSTRHARSRPGGDFARVSSSADARDQPRDAVTHGHPRRSPRSDPRLDPTRERGRRGRDVPHGTARGFAALAASPPRRGREDGDFPAGTRVAAGPEEAAAEETEEDPSLSARSRDDPHDDESGKTPRAAFHARMRASLAARDPAEALRVFDELSDVYPDDQGAPAYDALMHMAALAGDPDAALDAFEASLALRYEPSSYQHGQIILAHARAGDPERGAEWLAELIETNGPEWSRTSKSASKLFERVLLGAAHAGDVKLFDAQFAKMRAAGAVPGETALEASLLALSLAGASSEAIEDVWRDDAFVHVRMATRSSKLLLRRVEAHARAARTAGKSPREDFDSARRTTVRARVDDTRPSSDPSAAHRPEGFLEEKMVVASTREGPRDAHVSAASSRRLGEEALRDLFARNSEPTEFKTKARNPRDVRDAVTAMAGAFAAAGDSDGVRALIERAGAVGVEPDQHVFNALLRSEAVASASGRSRDEDEDFFFDRRDESESENENDASFSYDDDDVEYATLDDGTAVPKPPVVAHFDARARETHRAVVRVETMMRDMIESGVEPDLHSFTALLSAYARAGDVAAAGDALAGMRERNIPVDTHAFNALLQACAVAGDLDAAVRIRDEMIRAEKLSGVAPDAVTFLHLFRACARRSRQVAAVLRDRDDWDDVLDDVLGGQGFGGRAHESHARLAGALVERRSDGDTMRVGDVGEAARAAIQSAKNAAREGLSSVTDVFARGVGGLASSEAGQGLKQSGSPELARARAAFVAFRDDMARSGVRYTRRCATAAMAALGSLREFDAMMAFLREPPPGVVPDAYMYTQALHSLAQDPFHWQRSHAGPSARAKPSLRVAGGSGAASPDATKPASPLTGPRAALALADEMQTRGIRGTRVTLNCALLACAQLRDYREARRRFEAHVGAGGEIGADTFNCLFKAAWSGGAFASEAAAIADEMETAMELDVACEPNAFTELTLRRAGEGNGDAYTPERAAAHDALVRFGFEREHAPETPWAPVDERGLNGVGVTVDADEGGVDGRDVGASTEEGAREKNTRREGRRWNR
jgi:pentatricopeptide repeat protein